MLIKRNMFIMKFIVFQKQKQKNNLKKINFKLKDLLNLQEMLEGYQLVNSTFLEVQSKLLLVEGFFKKD